jgi:phosphoribosylformimino-5-aminoimidazole carboxamide ribotide isomerase
MKIIPAIDIQNGNCVRLKQGDFTKETIFHSSPIDMAQKWVDEGAERLHIVDLDGARLGSPINMDGYFKNMRQVP